LGFVRGGRVMRPAHRRRARLDLAVAADGHVLAATAAPMGACVSGSARLTDWRLLRRRSTMAAAAFAVVAARWPTGAAYDETHHVSLWEVQTGPAGATAIRGGPTRGALAGLVAFTAWHAPVVSASAGLLAAAGRHAAE